MLGYYHLDANAIRYQHRRNNHLLRCKLFHCLLLLRVYHKDVLFQGCLFLQASTLALWQLGLILLQISGGHMHDQHHHQLIHDRECCFVISQAKHRIQLKYQSPDRHCCIRRQMLLEFQLFQF